MSKYRFTIVGNDKTKAMFQSIKAGLGGVREQINSTSAKFVAIAGPAGLGALVATTVKAETELVRLARSVNVSSDTMSEWAHAAGTVNIESDKMADIFKDVSDKIGDFARTGGGAAADMFEQLNLDIHELRNLKPDEQLLKIGTALESVNSESEKIFFLEALAGDASRLLPLLENNGEQLQALQQEARDFGVSISEVDAAKLEAANRSFERIGGAVKGLKNRLSVQLAPVISVVAEKVIGVATEGNNMGKVVTKAIGWIVKGVGVLADGVRGVQVIFAGLKVAGSALAAGLVGAFTGLASVVTRVFQGIKLKWIEVFAAILTPLAKLSDTAAEVLTSLKAELDEPFKDPPFLAGLKAKTEELSDTTGELKDELHALLLEELPSAVFEQKWNEIQAEAERRAQQTANVIRNNLENSNQGAAGDSGETEAERIEKEKAEAKAERERQQTADRLARLDLEYATELEKLEIKYQNEYAVTAQAFARGVIQKEEYIDRLADIDERYAKAQANLEAASGKARLAMIGKTMNGIAGFVSSGSKKLFKAQKAASLAQALVSVPAAVIDSFRNAGGYPWGIGPAIAMAATGAAQIASIKKQKLGGGGGSVASVSGGGSSGSAPSAPTPGSLAADFGSQFDPNRRESARPTTVLNLSIAGDVVGDTAENILGKMRTLIEDGDAVLFSANSRQAAELVPAG